MKPIQQFVVQYVNPKGQAEEYWVTARDMEEAIKLFCLDQKLDLPYDAVVGCFASNHLLANLTNSWRNEGLTEEPINH